MAVTADNHCFLDQFLLILTKALIVLDNVFSHTFQTLTIAKNYLHLAHILLTLINVGGQCAFFLAFLVVSLNLLGLLGIKEDSGKASIVLDRNGNLIVLGLFHSVAVNDSTEDLDGLLDGRTGETHKCGGREGFVELLGESLGEESANVFRFSRLQLHL